MPIRTNRGRAAVYRRLWGWPLRSPKHLTVTLVIAAIAIAVIGVTVTKIGAANRHPQNAAATASGVPTTTKPPVIGPASTSNPVTPTETRLTTPLVTPSSAPPSPQALETAKKWVTAWANHPDGMGTQQWIDGLRPYTTEEYLGVMESVDPSNVPATRVTGDAVATKSLSSSVEVEVPTDAGRIAVTMIQTDQGWRVAHHGKVE